MISLRKLLFVVPAFVAVGVAAACGPYSTPTVCGTQPQQLPQTYYYEPVTNSNGQTTYVMRCVANSQAYGTSLSVIEGKIQVQTADGGKMICEKMSIPVNGVEPVTVSVAEKEIRLASGKDVKGGDLLQASAQKITRMGVEGATLVLEGNAKLVYVRQGKKIDVSTDLLSVNLSTGQVISELEVKPVKPVPPPILTPAAPTEPQAGPVTTFPPRGTAAPRVRETEPDRDPPSLSPRP